MVGRTPCLTFLAACALAACTNGGGLGNLGGSTGGGGGSPSPVPPDAIGVGLPTGTIGVENDPTWGTVGGYTQSKTSQVLALAPGSKVTITNLSSSTPHTLNVIAKTNGPPADFPANPPLSFSARGNGVLGKGYASGTIAPGASVTVTLSNPGIYLIGCAFHYVEFAMRDVIEVSAGATPGPSASPGTGSDSIPAAASAARLIDQRGHPFSLASLRGTPSVVTFVSAHCTDACPLIDAQFADAARRIEREHIAGRLLTITLDPQHDSPATMRALAKRFDANPRVWLVAGGAPAEVRTIERAFGVVSVRGERGYRDRHTTFVYVFDAAGHLTRAMLASSDLGDAIVDAVRT